MELVDARQLRVEDVEHGVDDVVVHDRRMLRLEAVRAVEVAAETRHDREREVRRVVAAQLVALGEQLDLVGVVGNEHAAERHLFEQLRRAVARVRVVDHRGRPRRDPRCETRSSPPPTPL